jgi:hypothetical protein|nr:MAG TPA: hypothetical protein [Caudoviricetes sp.]
MYDEKRMKENIIDCYREKVIQYEYEIEAKEKYIELLKSELQLAKIRCNKAKDHLKRCLDSYDKEYGTKETD